MSKELEEYSDFKTALCLAQELLGELEDGLDAAENGGYPRLGKHLDDLVDRLLDAIVVVSSVLDDRFEIERSSSESDHPSAPPIS